MKEFDFEQTVKKVIKRLREDLQRYKERYSLGFQTIENEKKRKPVEVYQIRELLTSPKEYVIIYHIEDTGLVHAIPLTEFVSLTPSNLRIYIKDLIFAPLPFHVYITQEVLEKISRPVAKVKQETIDKVLENVEKLPTSSNIKPVNEFIELVWKKYEKLTVASLLYNVIKKEGGLDN